MIPIVDQDLAEKKGKFDCSKMHSNRGKNLTRLEKGPKGAKGLLSRFTKSELQVELHTTEKKMAVLNAVLDQAMAIRVKKLIEHSITKQDTKLSK